MRTIALCLLVCRYLGGLGVALGLWASLMATPAWAQGSAVSDSVSQVLLQNEYDNLMVHAEGQYQLWRDGSRVIAVFRSQGSAVQYAARQDPQDLFTVPLGFRPEEPLILEGHGWPLHPDGTVNREAEAPQEFRMAVGVDGTARYLDGPELDEVGHLAYVLTTTWYTPETSGPYALRTEHHQSRFALRRTEETVTGVLSTSRSPVQHFARQAPAILFSVPPGYRPREPVIIEVKDAQHVDWSGQVLDDQPESQTFRLQVDPDGAVRYVDDAGVDEVGYLAYAVAVEWPTAELPLWRPSSASDQADVCHRHAVLQTELRSLLEAQDGRERTCADITWAELASLTTLAVDFGLGHATPTARDLGGLLGLRQLTLFWPVLRPLPGDLLSRLPQLPSLHLELYYTDLSDTLLEHLGWLQHVESQPYDYHRWSSQAPLPAGFLTHSPQLEELTVQVTGHPYGYWSPFAFPTGFLAGNPRLRQLTVQVQPLNSSIDGLLPLALSADLLRHNPQLQVLTLEADRLAALPHGFLAHNQALESLSIQSELLRPLPRDFLMRNRNLEEISIRYLSITQPAVRLADLFAHKPRLKSVEIGGYVEPELPSNLFVHNPQLHRLVLEVHKLQTIPPDLLAANPFLREVVLDTYDLTELPSGLFAHNPWLRNVKLEVDQVTDLPPDLFAHNPHLLRLELRTRYTDGFKLAPLADLLSRNPQLHDLTLNGNWYRLPPGFLARNTQLQRLAIHVPYAELPSDLLAHNKQLLDLQVWGFSGPIPGDLVARNPLLQRLSISARHLQSVPSELLVHNPDLQQLTLFLDETVDEPTEISEDLLAHNSRLQHLQIHGSVLIPADFLRHNPRLAYLDLSRFEKALPAGLLEHNPLLQKLLLYHPDMTELPAGLLAHNLQLQHLAIGGARLQSLPSGFLAHNPNLLRLQITIGRLINPAAQLAALPDDFLTHNPQLEVLALISPALEVLPARFLGQSPRLQEVHIEAPPLKGLPTGFLSASRRLRQLTIHYAPFLTQVPSDFLTDHPQLRTVSIQNSNLSRGPRAFLSQSPNLRQVRIVKVTCKQYVPRTCEEDLLAAWLRAEEAETG